MKLSVFVLLIISILLVQFNTLCQELAPPTEIYTLTSGFGENDSTKFYMEPFGSKWCFSLSSGYYLDPNAISINAIEFIKGNYDGSGSQVTFGFQICYQNDSNLEKFWLGIYKVTISTKTALHDWMEQIYIYLDFGDCWYGRAASGGCNSNDIILRIHSDGLLEWAYGVPTPNTEYSILNEGNILNWWEANECNSHCVVDLDNFWQNCLVIISSAQNNLRPVWGPNPGQQNIYKYYLYRKINSDNYIRISAFNSTTFDYVDKSVTFSMNTDNTAYYYVTSYNGTESDASNISTVNVDFNWSNGLILSRNGNNPMLVWVPNTTVQTLTGYKIYRNIDGGVFYYLGTLGVNTLTYTDNEVNLSTKESSIGYYVAATDGTVEDTTNTVYAIGDYNPRKETQQTDEKIEISYSLSENYPNPFNPITHIEFQIADFGLVILKVYDILGEEMATLVNEYKPAGKYEVQFSAKGLPSGMYFYSITAGKFHQTKKMILFR